MAQAWYLYKVTQAYGVNGEEGVDLGTPFHTPITALYAGTVRWAGRTQWPCGSSGGEVTIVCNVPELGVTTSYYLHLDEVYVKTGDVVPQGAVIGLSGGQLSGGQWPVINCPQRGVIYSSGPHTEFGFKASWVSGPGNNVNPMFAITQARNNGLPTTTPSGSAQYQTQNYGASNSQVQIDPSAIEAGLLQFYNMSSVTHRVITQPTGFDGICEAIDAAEQMPPFNFMNPFGSIIADFKPLLVRGLFMFIAGIILAFVLWEYIRGPLELIAGLGISAAAPEAAPAVQTMMAPQASAR